MQRLTLLLLFSTFLSLGCGESPKESNNKEGNDTISIPKKKAPTKRIEREIPVKQDFFQITNISNTTVEFTTGAYNVWIEGDSTSVSYVGFDVDGGILTISTPLDTNNDITSFPSSSDVIVHVSCPELRTMAICAGGGFVCHETMKAEQIQLGGMVGGSINIDSIACSSFRYDSNGNTSLNIGGISCKEGVIITTGGGNLNLNIDATESCYIDVKGKSNLNATAKCPKVESMIETDGSVNLSLKAHELLMDALGGTISLSGHVDRPRIRKGKLAIINDGLN